MRLLSAGLVIFFLIGCSSWQSKKQEAELHLQMGVSNFETANYPMALRELLTAEQLDSSNAVVQNNLGLTYFMRERYDLAEKHLRSAVSLQPDYTDARNNLARVLIELNRPTEAEKQLDLVLNDLTYSGTERAWINMGLARFHQKNWPAAKEAFGKAIEAQRDSCIANDYYGRTWFEMAQYRQAAESLDRAVSFCQKQLFDEPHYYSALAWYRLGDKDKSTARFEQILRLYPDGKFVEKSRAMLDLIHKGVE